MQINPLPFPSAPWTQVQGPHASVCPTFGLRRFPGSPFSLGIGESCSILTPRGNHKSLCVTQAFSNLFKASSLFPAHLNQSKPPPSSPAAKDWSVGKKRASASKLSKKKASKVFFPIPIFLPERRQEGELMALHRASALLFHAGVHFCVHQPLCALTFVCTVQLCKKESIASQEESHAASRVEPKT